MSVSERWIFKSNKKSMSDDIREKQGANSPRQLELFSVDDFVKQVVRRSNFGEDTLEYFKERKIPPNDKDKYYFGVEFDNKEHELLITIFKKPKDVLDFYLRVFRSVENKELDKVRDIFDRNKVEKFVGKLLNENYSPFNFNVNSILSAAGKVATALKKNERLLKIVKSYEKIFAQEEEKKIHSEVNSGKGNKSGKIIRGDKLTKGNGNGGEGVRLDRDKVVRKIGGWDNLWNSVDRAIARLYAQNQGQKEYVWENIITEDWIESFVNEIAGVENLLFTEKKMIKEIVKWMFDEKREEEMGSVREY